MCAIEWQDNNQRRTDALRGLESTAAEGWSVISQSMQLLSTNLQQEYIVFSRETVRRLQRLIYLAIAAGFILVLGITAFALVQRQQAMIAKEEAEKQRQLAEGARGEADIQRRQAVETARVSRLRPIRLSIVDSFYRAYSSTETGDGTLLM